MAMTWNNESESECESVSQISIWKNFHRNLKYPNAMGHYCLSKKIDNLLQTHFRGKKVEWGIFYYYSKTFLILFNKLLLFSV